MLVSGVANEFVQVDYRTDLHLLACRWLRSVSWLELQAGFEAARQLAEEYQARHWLVDVRRRTELDAEASTWVATQFLPSVARQLAPISLRVAYLLAPSRAEQLTQDAGLKTAVDTAQSLSQPYRLRTFMDEREAVEWLLRA